MASERSQTGDWSPYNRERTTPRKQQWTEKINGGGNNSPRSQKPTGLRQVTREPPAPPPSTRNESAEYNKQLPMAPPPSRNQSAEHNARLPVAPPPSRNQSAEHSARLPAAPPPSRSESSENQKASPGVLPVTPPTLKPGVESPRDSPRAPEIVDFAPASTWTRNSGLLQLASKRSSKSQCSARQSEVSFGILEYYTRGPSIDEQKTPPPPTPKIAMDPAIDKFDFGLAPDLELTPPGKRVSRPKSKILALKRHMSSTPDATTGAEISGPLITITPEQETNVPRRQRQKTSYNLFPSVQQTGSVCAPSKEPHHSSPPHVPAPAVTSPTTPTSGNHQSISAITTTTATPPQPNTQPNQQQSDSESKQQPKRPRNASLPNSIRSRKDSFTSFHYPNKRIPLRVLSTTSTPTAAVQNLTASVVPPRASPAVSSSTAPPWAASVEHSPVASAAAMRANFSRWSDDEPTPPSLTRHTSSTPPVTPGAAATSFDSLLASAAAENSIRSSGRGSGGVEQFYPDCFFEDDEDDEAAPLRRKLRWKRSESLSWQRQKRMGSGASTACEGVGGIGSGGSGEVQRRSRSLWRALLCGCADGARG